MPNRIIKESAFTSDRIAGLSDFEFRLWVGLITMADDAGRGDARPAIIKGRVFPLRERVAIKDIENALHALAAHSCVSLYTVGGKPYYAFPHWGDHQRVRDAKPKYPGIEESDNNSGEIIRSAASCGESPRTAAECGLNPIQSNPNPNHNPNPSVCGADKPRSHFTPPTVDEVAQYCRERGNCVDPERFVDFYASKGWQIGKAKMKDWKACVRTWEQREKKPIGMEASMGKVNEYGVSADYMKYL